MPFGSFANVEKNAAKLGYQIGANYDISFDQDYGISTGILIGQNTLNNSSINFNKGNWSYVLIELGGFVQIIDNLKFKGLISTGNYASPELSFENGTATLNKIAIGVDLKVEYNFDNFYIGSNFLYAKPEFKLLNGNPIGHAISNLGFIIGYSF